MDIIELVKTLVSIPSQIGNTSEIEGYVASQLENINGSTVELQSVPGHGNNVIATSIKNENLPTILINGHLDTVEICSGWTRDPFEPAIEGDKLYGLGSADMQSGVAVGMNTFERLAKLDNVNVIFAGTVDEEGDSTGAFTLLDSGIEADLCLIPEPSSGTIMMGCRGRTVFQIDVNGTSAHGARPEEGVNAISEASKFIGKLGELPLLNHSALPRGSYCVLEISGGTRTLSVPDTCRVKLDRHYVIGESKDDILKQLEEMASGFGSHASFEIGFSPERQTPFLEPYITEKEGLAKEFLGLVGGKITYGKSVGDYNAFSKRMPTVVYGPHGENWHGADEWVSLSSVQKVWKNYENFADYLAGKDF